MAAVLSYQIKASAAPTAPLQQAARLELGCQRPLEDVAEGLQRQLLDWLPLITATRRGGTAAYLPSPLDFACFARISHA